MAYKLISLDQLDEIIPTNMTLDETSIRLKQSLAEIIQDGKTLVFHNSETGKFTAAEMNKPLPPELANCMRV